MTSTIPPLPERLRAIVDAGYPRFSDHEMASRRARIKALLAEAQCNHLIFCGANRFGSGVQWLTGWPVTAEAVGVFTPGEQDALFVQYHNHVPLARTLADRANVRWGELSCMRMAAAELERRGAQAGKVGYIGPLTADQHEVLAGRFNAIKNLNKSYVRLRMIKTLEELDWLRIGAHFSDLGMMALRDGVRPGLTERELGDLVERAYVAQGALNVIHYFGVTPMRDPGRGAGAVSFNAARCGRRHRVRRDQRGVLGLSRTGAAQFRSWRADAALSRAACGGGRGV